MDCVKRTRVRDRRRVEKLCLLATLRRDFGFGILQFLWLREIVVLATTSASAGFLSTTEVPARMVSVLRRVTHWLRTTMMLITQFPLIPSQSRNYHDAEITHRGEYRKAQLSLTPWSIIRKVVDQVRLACEVEPLGDGSVLRFEFLSDEILPLIVKVQVGPYREHDNNRVPIPAQNYYYNAWLDLPSENY